MQRNTDPDASTSAPPARRMALEHPTRITAACGEATTKVYVSNLHCSSCVQTIKDALSSLSPTPTSVHVSVITQFVTIRHHLDLSQSAIEAAIDEAGFDIVDTTAGLDRRPLFHHSLSRLPALITGKSQKHFDQCTLCQEEISSQHRNRREVLMTRARSTSGEATLVSGFDAGKELETSSLAKTAQVTPSVSSYNQATIGPRPDPQLVTLSVGGMTCASCSNTITELVSAVPGVSVGVVNLLGNSATVTVENAYLARTVVETIEDAGYEAEVVSMEPLTVAPPPWQASAPGSDRVHRVTLSVGGMTCVSCSNTVTDVMSAIPGISEVVVNLLAGSATAVVNSKGLASEVAEAIEDAGYEAEIISTQAIKPMQAKNEEDASGPRTVSLQIDGMFCQHCPGVVTSALAHYEARVNILKPVTCLSDPIVQFSYLPDPPSFTLRTLAHAIAHSSSSTSPFTVTVHHPPTVEARARQMQRREQLHLLQRLIFAIIVAIPTFIIGIVYMSLVSRANKTRMWFERPMWAGNASRAQWAMFILATPVMFYSAGTFHRRSIKEIWALWRRGSRTPIWRRFVRFGSMNLLVSTGVTVAYFASIALLALAASRPPASSGPGDTTTYFDSVVFLTMFLLAGRFLEAYSKGRTADAITALGKLRPTSALVFEDASIVSRAGTPPESVDHNVDLEKGDPASDDPVLLTKSGIKLERVDVGFLEIGDIVRVQHGASPPADGTVVSGEGGAFDESSLTGESRLVKKMLGDHVFLGTINKGAIVDVRVNAIGGETMLDRVVKVVREGQTHRAPIERVADLLTGYFVPVVTLLAIVTWVVWLGLGLGGALPQDYLDIDVGGWTVWSLEFAIAVFVVACPCGIGLAAPTALLVGSGLAAKFGILARGGGEAFQEAAQLDIIVFDKTGTLTEGGEPRVTDVEVVDTRWPREVLLGVAAEVESASSHPLALAIRQYCADNAAAPQTGSAFEETPGRGLRARFEALKSTIIIGNEEWMSAHGLSVDGKLANTLDHWKSEGKSVVLLALGDSKAEKALFILSAMFAIADPLRPEAKGVIAHLHSQDIGTWMISGDNAITAKAVARSVGIPETNVIAGVLPHEKAEKIQWLQQVGTKRRQARWRRFFGKQRLNDRCIVAMVGDGINDAPALAAADVGIAIGSGSDVAISTASFILVSSNLQSLLTLTDLSRKVFNRVKFNFLWATIYNFVAVPIAAGVIYPAGHARLSPVWASLAMALSSVSVVCSSLMLKLYKEPSPQAK